MNIPIAIFITVGAYLAASILVRIYGSYLYPRDK